MYGSLADMDCTNYLLYPTSASRPVYIYMYLIGDNLCQVQLLLGTVNKRLPENSGYKDGSHSHETIGSESLDHKQLVQCLSNRSCRNQYIMLMTRMYMYLCSMHNNQHI